MQVREGIMEWTRVVHGGGGQDGKTMAGADKEGTWMQVMQAVTTGSDVEVSRFQARENKGLTKTLRIGALWPTLSSRSRE